MKGYLVLEDGTMFCGKLIKNISCSGEVVFNTGMTGYQEILTDPSYKGQIVVMTYPLIGNYGVNDEYSESLAVSPTGYIVSEICGFPSNHMNDGSLIEYLSDRNIPILYDVDTRKIVKHIREQGCVKGFIVDEEKFNEIVNSDVDVNRNGNIGMYNNKVEAVDEVENINNFRRLEAAIEPTVDVHAVVKAVTTDKIYTVGEDGKVHIALIDFGCKRNIINSLVDLGCKVTVVPYNTDYDTILGLKPDGVLLSNGPGDPKDVIDDVRDNIKALAEKLPIFGICLGHQLMALTFGCDTFKLKYGHRGCNHPVKDLKTSRVYITSQNHGYSVCEENIPSDVTVTHINLNDGTVEGLSYNGYKASSVQYHPEAAPGPMDNYYLFRNFLEVIGNGKGN